jgi:hypothetical protein
MNTSNQDTCRSYSPISFMDRLRWKLYPAAPCRLPEAPATYKDVLVCRVYIGLSLVDRLRVLLSGRLVVESKTVTENEIGGLITGSSVYVRPPSFLERKPQV